MAILAALGFTLFILAVWAWNSDQKFYEDKLEQKDKIIGMWRAEAASRAQIISRLRNEREEL